MYNFLKSRRVKELEDENLNLSFIIMRHKSETDNFLYSGGRLRGRIIDLEKENKELKKYDIREIEKEIVGHKSEIRYLYKFKRYFK
jgi:hypothetical protein